MLPIDFDGSNITFKKPAGNDDVILSILITIFSFLILKKQNKMSEQLDKLTQDIQTLTDKADQAIALIVTFKTDLDAAIAAGNDADQLAALSAKVEAETQKLQDTFDTNQPPATA